LGVMLELSAWSLYGPPADIVPEPAEDASASRPPD